MKNNYISVTIGIPAYNEEANIGFLLDSLLRQTADNFGIEKIVVVSDASQDRTDEIVKNFKSKKVKLLRNETRQGQAFSQNRILDQSRSDALVLLNADIGIYDPEFVKRLITPILNRQADLTSPRLKAVFPSGLVEKAVWVGFEMRDYMFERFRGGQSVHTCWGAARAFSKAMSQNFRFKTSISEDAYSYFYCKKHGYTYRHISDTECLFKLSDTVGDHKKQSLRNIKGREMLIKEFGEDFVKEEYPGPAFFFGMPPILILQAMTRTSFKYPIYLIIYLAITVSTLVSSLFLKKLSDNWSISTSSKTLIRFMTK